MVTVIELTFFNLTELVETCLSHAKRLQSLNAFTCFREEQVREEAAEADQRHLVFIHYLLSAFLQNFFLC